MMFSLRNSAIAICVTAVLGVGVAADLTAKDMSAVVESYVAAWNNAMDVEAVANHFDPAKGRKCMPASHAGCFAGYEAIKAQAQGVKDYVSNLVLMPTDKQFTAGNAMTWNEHFALDLGDGCLWTNVGLTHATFSDEGKFLDFFQYYNSENPTPKCALMKMGQYDDGTPLVKEEEL
jgi:hypothetical protein